MPEKCFSYFEGLFDTLAGIEKKLDAALGKPVIHGSVVLCLEAGRTCQWRDPITYHSSPGVNSVICFCQSAVPCGSAEDRIIKIF